MMALVDVCHILFAGFVLLPHTQHNCAAQALQVYNRSYCDALGRSELLHAWNAYAELS